MGASVIGSFTLIKNEAPWIGAHLEAWLPHLSEMVFFDGDSRDGTLEIILDVVHNHPLGDKVKLFTGKDPIDLQDDYVRLFDECLRSVSCDMALFLHPDMFPESFPDNLDHIKGAVAASVGMRSFGGEPDGKLYEINGRSKSWKNIYRLRNPDFGAHYHGHYGASTEDVYFKAITGNRHVMYESFDMYPYKIVDSRIKVLHYSDVRPFSRRVDRMVKCLLNNGWDRHEAEAAAATHPRVTFKDEGSFKFTPCSYPDSMISIREKYRHLERSLANV